MKSPSAFNSPHFFRPPATSSSFQPPIRHPRTSGRLSPYPRLHPAPGPPPPHISNRRSPQATMNELTRRNQLECAQGPKTKSKHPRKMDSEIAGPAKIAAAARTDPEACRTLCEMPSRARSADSTEADKAYALYKPLKRA